MQSDEELSFSDDYSIASSISVSLSEEEEGGLQEFIGDTLGFDEDSDDDLLEELSEEIIERRSTTKKKASAKKGTTTRKKKQKEVEGMTLVKIAGGRSNRVIYTGAKSRYKGKAKIVRREKGPEETFGMTEEDCVNFNAKRKDIIQLNARGGRGYFADTRTRRSQYLYLTPVEYAYTANFVYPVLRAMEGIRTVGHVSQAEEKLDEAYARVSAMVAISLFRGAKYARDDITEFTELYLNISKLCS